MDDYNLEGTNTIDWLISQSNIQTLLNSNNNNNNNNNNNSNNNNNNNNNRSNDLNALSQQPHYGIEPSLIHTNATTSFEQLLNTPSAPSFYSPSPHITDDLDRRINKLGKRQRIGASEANTDDQRSILDDEASTAITVQQLVDAVPVNHPLSSIGAWSCSRSNCFLRTPLPNQPLDYFKDPFIFGTFAVQIFDPSDRPLSAESIGDTFSRPSGRSVHLIVSQLPLLSDPGQLDSGYAIIIAARRIQQSWQAICMVYFEGKTTAKTRGRTNEIAFRGNLEYCKGESGQRFWSQRSSHVRKTEREDALKPLRIEPKGRVGMETVDEYCFFVGLFEENGTLINHIDGSACIAQSNIVRFEPKIKKETGVEVDGKYSNLMREINKLSLTDRSYLTAIWGMDESLKALVAVSDEKLIESVGIKTFVSEKIPESATELSGYLQKYLESIKSTGFEEQKYNSNAEQEYKTRLQAVARQIGRHHTDTSLLDTTKRSFEVGSTLGAQTRYSQIINAGVDDANEWLSANEIIKPNIHAVAARAEHAAFLMRDLRFKSKWMVSMNNVYPDRVLVDSKDAEKVYCLANTTIEAEVGLRDRVAPLARLAFCSKIPRDSLKETILIPYCQGFLERFPQIELNKDDILQTQIGEPYNDILVDEDKFFIALHAMFLDFYLYWIRFRSIDSVKRISQRLLEDDEKLNSWFFEPSRLVKFQ